MFLCIAADALSSFEVRGVTPILSRIVMGDGPEQEASYIARGAVVTIIVGSLLWFADHWRLKRKLKAAYAKPFISPESLQRFDERKRNATNWQLVRIYAGIFFLFISFVTAVIPIYGIVVAAAVVAVNWKVGSWPLRYSFIGFCVTCFVTCIFMGFEIALWWGAS